MPSCSLAINFQCSTNEWKTTKKQFKNCRDLSEPHEVFPFFQRRCWPCEEQNDFGWLSKKAIRLNWIKALSLFFLFTCWVVDCVVVNSHLKAISKSQLLEEPCAMGMLTKNAFFLLNGIFSGCLPFEVNWMKLMELMWRSPTNALICLRIKQTRTIVWQHERQIWRCFRFSNVQSFGSRKNRK